jgi:hypothetical protein
MLRLNAAWGTFLNPDEALHYMIANQASFMQAYEASRTTAHPPLLILLLYFWRAFGTSEFVLRLPLVVAGTAFCWVCFKWLISIFGRTAAWIGFVLVTFLPPLIELSAEVRQYALLVFFTTSAMFLLERAFSKNSAKGMLLSSICLYLGMLCHYSALLFAVAVGVYGALRIVACTCSRKVVAVWLLGQAGALGLFLFLYATHISKVKGSAVGAANTWLSKSFFHPGQDNLILFVVARTGGVFQYVFGELAVGDIAFLAFVAGVVLLLRGKILPVQPGVTGRQLGALLLLPFAAGASASIAEAYPYGGTRHSAFLIMFVVAGVGLFLAWLVKGQTGRGIAIAILIVAVCNAFGRPHRPAMLREDQSRVNMARALDFIQQNLPPSDLIFADYQTRLLLGHYLCPQRPISPERSVQDLEEFQCAGHRVIFADFHTWRFEPEPFLGKWDEMVRTYSLRTGEAVWVVQAGWDIDLAAGLASKFPALRGLRVQSFGRNIQIFRLTVGQPRPNAAPYTGKIGASTQLTPISNRLGRVGIDHNFMDGER